MGFLPPVAKIFSMDMSRPAAETSKPSAQAHSPLKFTSRRLVCAIHTGMFEFLNAEKLQLLHLVNF